MYIVFNAALPEANDILQLIIMRDTLEAAFFTFCYDSSTPWSWTQGEQIKIVKVIEEFVFGISDRQDIE